MEAQQRCVAFRLLFRSSLVVFVLTCLSLLANATGNGISGFSGKTGSTCTACHSTGAVPTVTLSGPTSVASGSTNTYTLTVSGSGNGSLDVASTAGSFTAGTGTKVLNSEIVHSSPSTSHSWTFTWTAPSVTADTIATLFGASVNSFSGGTGTVQQAITVTAPAPAPTMNVSPSSLSFSFQQGGANPASQSISVSSSGSAVAYSVATSTTTGGAWLSASPTSGTTPGSTSISVNPAGLAPGTYSGTATVSSSTASNSPRTVPVTLTVTAAALPSLSVSPTNLSFAYQIGSATPSAQSFSVSSSGAAVAYTVASSAVSGGTWLSATPASGTTPGNVSVSVNPTGLAAGTYSGTVTVSSAGVSNSPRTVSVSLTVTAAPLPSLAVSPASLSFSYQTGGTLPASQGIAVSSSGSALSYGATSSGGAWLVVNPSRGTTPGNLSVSVNPSGLTAGTYNGTVSVSAAGSSNSPRTVAVALVVTDAPSTNPTLNVSPGTLSFSYQAGASASGSQNLTIASSGGALSFTASTSGGTWLSVSPTSGSTPGSVKVSVNAAGLAAGTYKGAVSLAATGASNSPQSVPVTLTVTSAGSGRLVARPGFVWFFYQTGHSDPLTKSIRVLGNGSPLSFTADAFGGGWLSVSPGGGTTSTALNISINPSGLAAGRYSGFIKLSAAGASPLNVPVYLRVATGDDEGEGDDDRGESEHERHAQPVVDDRTESGSVAAAWVDGAGVPANDAADPLKQGLMITKNSTASTRARAGVVLRDVEGLTLTQLGFDIRNGSHCDSRTPSFVVVTTDGVAHNVGGCGKGTTQPAPALGWRRLRFDPTNPAQASPAITPGSKVKSIFLLLDEGPDAGTGMAVLDNINVNGRFIGSE